MLESPLCSCGASKTEPFPFPHRTEKMRPPVPPLTLQSLQALTTQRFCLWILSKFLPPPPFKSSITVVDKAETGTSPPFPSSTRSLLINRKTVFADSSQKSFEPPLEFPYSRLVICRIRAHLPKCVALYYGIPKRPAFSFKTFSQRR